MYPNVHCSNIYNSHLGYKSNLNVHQKRDGIKTMWHVCVLSHSNFVPFHSWVIFHWIHILLNYKVGWNCTIGRDVDRPRNCHIEWSKSEKEKQISYNVAYVCNLEKWHRWTYLQSRNREQTWTPSGRRAGWIRSLRLTYIHSYNNINITDN